MQCIKSNQDNLELYSVGDRQLKEKAIGIYIFSQGFPHIAEKRNISKFKMHDSF